MNLTKKLSLLGATFLTAASFSIAPAFAQDDTTTAAEEEESIVVTGSRLRRDPVNAATPLIQVQREALINSGEANIVDYLADIPALQNSIVPEDTTGSGLGDGGLSLLNLRNLGSIRTLVLVDGRRHVGSGQGAPQVDIDTIPRLLIDNVEVVTGGASAIYGADAIGGVVNFILRRDFEGLEFDAVYAQINQDGQFNQRYSGLWGSSGLNDRLHVYIAAEYEASEEVMDRDIDWQRENCTMLNRDTDPNAATPDGVFDTIPLCGLRTYSRPFGGLLTLSHNTAASPAGDPDIPNSPCSLTSLGTNCFLPDPPFSYQFQTDGTPYLVDYGTYRDENGALRTTSVGGSGDELWRFGDSRLPEAEAFRFQTGGNFDILPNIELFGELKAVQESTLDNFQPAFFDIIMYGDSTVTPGNNYNSAWNQLHSYGNGQAELWSLNQWVFNGVGNPFVDPAIMTLINDNARGGVGDPRAQIRFFTDDLGSRPQENTRDVWRGVLGLRGDLDQLAFINNFQWEVGYTQGSTSDENVEGKTIDVERLTYATDAVVDTLGEVNGNAGETVCRVQLLNAQAVPLVDQAALFNGVFQLMDPTDERITGCVPVSLFGSGGLAPAYDYIVTSQRWTHLDEQKDFMAFFSGDTWDFWGAGPIGVAGGYEWREELFSGDFFADPNRLLFANLLPSYPRSDFHVNEVFAELNIPILSGLPAAESIEFNAAYRYSDYSTGVTTDTWSTTGTWRISQDIMLTGSYGFSVRAPSLGELYSPQGQTFLALVDNCSSTVIAAANPTVAANRTANCEAVWPGIISSGYTDPQPNSTNNGRSGGNPGLLDEESTSYTYSVALTPRFIPNFALRFDYYDIEIVNVIAALTLQQIMNNCVDGDSPNLSACALLTREDNNSDGNYDFAANDGEVVDFLQSPVNYANFRARGIDFTARYAFDLANVIGADWGSIDYSLRGSWQLQRDNATDPVNPQNITELDSTIGNPHVRLLSSLTWSNDRLALTWEVDWQSAQEIIDEDDWAKDPDQRDRDLIDTEPFTQHDFMGRFNLNDNVSFRAGVINAFDEEPTVQAIGAGIGDNFDLFGRRFFVGLTLRH